LPFLEEWLAGSFMAGKSSLLGAAAVLVFSIIAAKIVDLVLGRILSALTRKSRIQLDSTLLRVLRRPVWLSIVLFGALTALHWVGPRPPFLFIFSALIESLLILIWTLAFNALVSWTTERLAIHLQGSGRQGTEMVRLGGSIARAVIVIGAIFFLLSLWHINITPLLASAGIAGVAVALAAKETLANFFGGVSVFLDQPFRTGDYIILDDGERGEVVDIGMRSTRLLTRDDVQISIPNSIIANTKIVNESAPQPRFRVRVKVGTAYGSDVDQVEETLISVAAGNPNVVSHPSPRVRFRSFGDSSLDFELLCWVQQPHDKGRVIHELNRAIYKAFAEAGIVIPFPQRDVHLFSDPGTERRT